MSENKYSVIVPIYNVETYLAQCIESVIQQSYPNWELLLVDDGSSDHSLSIAKEYEKKDSRIHVITKTHGGLPQTRNYGLRQVTGNYVALLDGDDYWHLDHLKNMNQIISDSECDMFIMNNHTNFTQNTCFQITLFPFLDDLNRQSLQKKLGTIFDLNNRLPASAVLTTYRTEFLKKYNSKYGEQYTCSEDLDFFLLNISNVNSILFGNHEFYYYRQDNQSAMTKNMTGEMLLSRLSIYKKWFDFFGDKEYPFISELICRLISRDILQNFSLYCDINNADPCKKILKKFWLDNHYIWHKKWHADQYWGLILKRNLRRIHPSRIYNKIIFIQKTRGAK